MDTTKREGIARNMASRETSLLCCFCAVCFAPVASCLCSFEVKGASMRLCIMD